MNVNAFCVNGNDGVFAVFRIPIDPELVGFANGDDGHWQISSVFHEVWLKNIATTITMII